MIPLSLAQKIVQNVEFSGYGPCVAVDSMTVKCRSMKRQGAAEIHTVEFTPEGLVVGMSPATVYANAVRPDILGTLSLIKQIYKTTPGTLTEIQFTPHIIVRMHYLWLEDPTADTRLVLVELLLDLTPVWHLTYTVPYNIKADPARWFAVTKLFTEFLTLTTKEHSLRQAFAGVSDNMLNACATAAKERAGEETQCPT